MGIPHSLLVQRLFHSRKSAAVFSNVLGIKLYAEGNLPKYDGAMWHFTD